MTEAMQEREMPKRIQRKRTKGWKMPPDTVYVGRPTKWGNPWRAGQDSTLSVLPMTAREAVMLYRLWIDANLLGPGQYRKPIAELRGKNLACWCPLIDKDGNPVACHAEVLLEIVNGG